MATNSTRSSSSKKARAKERDVPSREPQVSISEDLPENVWRIGIVVIFVIAAVLRLYDLNLVPLHHDEGVNGNFLVRLVREGYYQYDPENYHGPTLYYFSALIPWIVKLLFGSSARDNYGLTTFTIRLVPAVFGLATIALVFMLRRRLGTIATLAAATMLAVSPGAVYLSRYFIHESLFVFFTFGIVVAGLKFYDERNPAYLIPAGASAALLFATKETAFISAGVLVIAHALTLFYMEFIREPAPSSGRRRDRESTVLERIKNHLRLTIDDLGGTTAVAYNLGLAVVVFLALYLLFYSSFLTNNNGIYDSLRTFAVWKKTGGSAHVHESYQYIVWLMRQESPLLLLGAAGALIAVLKPRNSLALFAALWAFGLIAAYSMIGYKTPWLVLSFLIPLALIAGYAIQAIFLMDHGRLRLASVIFLMAIGVAAYQAIDLNFIHYDDDDEKYVYVYAHSKRELLDLVKQVEQIANEQSGRTTGISIVSPDYWPLPWYFRNFSRVGYFGRMAATSEPIIIANENQKEEIDRNFGEVYRQVPSKSEGGSFELRPGVKLLLYVRRVGIVPVQNPPSIHNP